MPKDPATKSAIDTTTDKMDQKLSADEQRLFRLYGKLPNKKDLLQNKLKVRLSLHLPIYGYILYHSCALTYPAPGAQVLRQRRLCPLQSRQGLRRRDHLHRPRAPRPGEDPAHDPRHVHAQRQSRSERSGYQGRGRRQSRQGGQLPAPRVEPAP